MIARSSRFKSWCLGTPSTRTQEVHGVLVLPWVLALFIAGAPPAERSVKALVAELARCQAMDCEPLRALIAKGDKVWPELEAGLDDLDEMVRFWTLGVLSEVPVAAARPRLIGLIKDPLVRIRAAAAFALGAQKVPEVVAPLIAALADPDVNVRFEAASALVRVPDERALEPLIKASADLDEDVRSASCEALGAIKDDRARAVLVDRLSDRKAIVRGHAALALGVMRAQKALEALIKRAGRERDAEALGAIAWALGAIGDRAALPALERLATHASEVVKAQAIEALARLRKSP